MAPQTSIPLAATVLGLIGTIFWCIQLIPQIWYNWRQKKTDGFPACMMFLWASCAFPFGVYAIVQNFNIPIQIQPHAFGVLSLISWSQILIYNHKWPVWKAASTAAATGVAFGGIEALLILTLRGPYSRGIAWPVTLVGVIAAILLGAGLIPPYFEMAKRSGRVVGIIAQHTFDVLGGIVYIVCILLEAGIFTSHIIFLLRTRSIRHRAKALGINFDEMPEASRYVYPRPDSNKTPAGDDIERGQAEDKSVGTIKVTISEHVTGEDCVERGQDVAKSAG